MRGARCVKAHVGFLSKRSAPEALLEAINAVAAGQRYIEAALAQKLALDDPEGDGRTAVERLSEREFEVFVRLAGGATVQRIAEDLKLSASTVGTHLYNIKQKLGVAEPGRDHADRDPQRPDPGLSSGRI